MRIFRWLKASEQNIDRTSVITVSDTTPIISLLKAGRLELLKVMFGEVIVPTAVYDELVSNPRFTDEAKLIKSSVFIRKAFLHNEQEAHLLRRTAGLDKGESEAIMLARERGAHILLMDEAKGRQVAKRMGLPVMGTLGLLLASCNRGLLVREDVVECIDAMEKEGIRISDTLHRYIIDRLDELAR